MMGEYFRMTYPEDGAYEPYGVAYAPSDVDDFVIPASGESIESWEVLEMELRDGNEFPDYLTNDLGARLCSARLRQVVDENCSSQDRVQWLEAKVSSADGRLVNYFILHFPVDIPVVNKGRSIWAGDMVVKPVLDREKVRDHDIFTLPHEPGRTVFVSSRLKAAIEKKGLTGVEFVKAQVSK